MKKNIKNILLTTILTIVTFIGMNVGINATEASQTSEQKDIEFNVKTVQSKNQLDKTKTYFHLLAKPGTRQKVEIIIENNSNRPLKINAKVATALTNKNGVVIYDGGHNDEKTSSSMKININDIVKLDNELISVPVKKSQTVGATITMPTTKIEGILLGGFNFSLADTDKNTVKTGVESKYQYNVGLILSQNDTNKLATSQKLELNDIETRVIDGSKVTTFNFDNLEEHMIKDLSLDFDITKKDSTDTILSHQEKSFGMAPNTIMSYNLDWGVKDIKSGIYTANIKAKSSDKEWTWTKDFEIKDDQAKEINEEAVNKLYYPTWYKYSIVILSIVTITNVIILIRDKRKSREV